MLSIIIPTFAITIMFLCFVGFVCIFHFINWKIRKAIQKENHSPVVATNEVKEFYFKDGLICSFIPSDIVDDQIKFLIEEEGMTEKEAWDCIDHDYDLYNFHWEYVYENLSSLMEQINPKGIPWIVEVENFGWRSSSGHKIIDIKNNTDGKELLWKILPNTDNSFNIYKEGNTIKINNAHHDSPFWKEWYTIQTIGEYIKENYIIDWEVYNTEEEEDPWGIILSLKFKTGKEIISVKSEDACSSYSYCYPTKEGAEHAAPIVAQDHIEMEDESFFRIEEEICYISI